MKAPVGLLSDGTVCVSRWRGLAPTSSMQVSVEDEIRNHKLTDIRHNMTLGGHEREVPCKSLPFQHGHRLRGAAAPGWKKNFHWLHRGRGCTGRDYGVEVGVGLSHLQWPAWLCGFDSEWWPGEIFEECGREPWVRNLNECWTLPFFGWWCPAFFSVARSILMESLYFYNFLYGSFIYSMLIFMHTDR